MKNQKVMALLLSIALSIFTCLPLGSITALGAETGSTAEASVQVGDSSFEEAAETEEEADSSSEAATVGEEKSDDNDEVLPENSQEEAVSSEEVDTAGEAEETDAETEDANASDETEADLPVLETEPSETESEAAENEGEPAASDETLEPAAETPAADNPVITAPAETETVKTDAQYADNGIDSDDMSSAIEIKVGDVRNVRLTEDDEYIVYRFVPEETAAYYFYSTDANVADNESYALLYSDDGEEIQTSSRTDDNGAFELECLLEKGETYYFKTFVYAYQGGSYTIHLVKKALVCSIVGDDYIHTSPGGEVTMEVNASSASEIDYQWTDSDGSIIEGATSSVCRLVPQKGGTYLCHISDGDGNSEELEFFIDIDNGLNIVPEGCEDTNYCEKKIKPGESLTLTAIATAINTEHLTYAWYVTKTYIDDATLIDGANSTSYTINSDEGTNTYICKVTDQYGNAELAYFKIYVNNLTAWAEGCEVGINCTIYALPNKSCTMRVIATADETDSIAYSWYEDDEYQVDGADSSSYTIDSVDGSQRWRCNVSDAYGNSEDIYFYIDVNHLKAYAENADENTDFVNITKALGSSVTLKVIATADDMSEVTYMWIGPDYEIIEGAESSSYTINSISETNSGSYSCLIGDQYGNSREVDFYIKTMDLSNAQVISVGDVHEVNVGQDVPATIFKFTPSYSGNYIINVKDYGAGPFIELYDESLTIITEINYEDNRSEDGNIYYSGMFTAGKSYYLEAAGMAYEGSYKLWLTQGKTTSIDTAKVTNIVNKVYNGAAQTQAAVVTLNGNTLKAGTDYTVSYKNNTNAGTATVTFTGKGNYTGTKTATFKINKAAQNIAIKVSAASIKVGKTATISVTGAVGAKSYKSSLATVATVNAAGTITAKKVGSTTITATAAATANYNAASKTVSIKVVPAATSSITAANQATGIKLTWKSVAGATGYKVYRGAALIKTIKGSTVTFTDKKANTNGAKYIFKIIPTSSTGDGLAKTLTTYRVARPAVSSVKNTAAKKMTVRWKKNAKANGYQIQYSTNKKFAKGNKTVNIAKAATVSKVIGGLAKGKTYYVRIRTYKKVGKAKYWSIWSPAKSVKITK